MGKTAPLTILVLSTQAFARDLPGTVDEYVTKVRSIFAPLGFTVAGGAALVGGSVLTGYGGLLTSLDSQRQLSGLDYGLLVVGSAALVAGAILLGYGIYRWIARRRSLAARYADQVRPVRAEVLLDAGVCWTGAASTGMLVPP